MSSFHTYVHTFLFAQKSSKSKQHLQAEYDKRAGQQLKAASCTYIHTLFTLHTIHPDRHPATTDTLVFGCINIRSMANKVDDQLQVRSDNSVDVMLLTETWHDKNSVCFGRLRSGGLSGRGQTKTTITRRRSVDESRRCRSSGC